METKRSVQKPYRIILPNINNLKIILDAREHREKFILHVIRARIKFYPSDVVLFVLQSVVVMIEAVAYY